MVVQTTQRIENLQSIVNYLLTVAKEIKIFNTICASTSMRQAEAKNLAKESDLMVVVGSKKAPIQLILRKFYPELHRLFI